MHICDVSQKLTGFDGFSRRDKTIENAVILALHAVEAVQSNLIFVYCYFLRFIHAQHIKHISYTVIVKCHRLVVYKAETSYFRLYARNTQLRYACVKITHIAGTVAVEFSSSYVVQPINLCHFHSLAVYVISTC